MGFSRQFYRGKTFCVKENEFKNFKPRIHTDETRTSQRLAHQTLVEWAIFQSGSRCFAQPKQRDP